jgi:integrative and conjugative element protein (TIGR02256 family)
VLSDLPFVEQGAKLLVEPRLIARLSTYRQTVETASESGGILMGYRRGVHIHVTECTFPHQFDRQSRLRYFRHAGYHHRIAVQRWYETGETLDYVGEWHTHPEDAPVPSSIDVFHWRQIAESG